MAPAQRLEQAESATRYSHKKFQGNRYAHKKFGTRTPSPPATVSSYPEECQQTVLKFQSNKDESSTTTIKKSGSTDIFRPYALGDNTPRKRKHQDVADNDEEIQHGKRFAITSPTPQLTPTPMGVTSPSLATPPPPPRFIFGAQPMQFNPQTFALMFQKQHAALCMGQMIKRLT